MISLNLSKYNFGSFNKNQNLSELHSIEVVNDSSFVCRPECWCLLRFISVTRASRSLGKVTFHRSVFPRTSAGCKFACFLARSRHSVPVLSSLSDICSSPAVVTKSYTMKTDARTNLFIHFLKCSKAERLRHFAGDIFFPVQTVCEQYFIRS